jgi:2-methylisocitrate lyase-like PEP mutase family enzyme
VMGFVDPALTLAQVADAGVKRISVGGAMARLALASFARAAKEMRERGGFTWVGDMIAMQELTPLLRGRS